MTFDASTTTITTDVAADRAGAAPVANLQARVLQAGLEIGVWLGQRIDRKVTREVEQDKNATAGAAKVTKQLVAKKWLEKVQQVAGAARAYHYSVTFPGLLSNGPRLLAVGTWETHARKLEEFRISFISEVDQFLSVWPQIRAASQIALGDLWVEGEFPTEDQVRRSFSFKASYFEVPNASNWILDIDADNLAALRREASVQVTDVLNTAVKLTFEKIEVAVAGFKEKLESFVPNSGKGTGLRDSLFNNLRGLAELLPDLNFSNDPRIAELGRDILQGLGNTDREEAKNSGERARLIRAAEGIEAKLAGWL